MKVLSNTIYYLFVTAIVVIALLLVATMIPIPGNLKAKIVKSGSMEPAIKTGGLVFVKATSEYKVGDVITFGRDTKTQIPTTHRIIEVYDEGTSQESFATKGDANDAPDPTATRLEDVSGKVVLHIPYLGYILDFAKKPIGFILLVGVPAAIIIFDELMKIVREIRIMRRKKLRDDKEENNQISEDNENKKIG